MPASQAPLRDRVPFGRWGPLGIAVDPGTWRAMPYLAVSGVLGLGYCVFLAFAIPSSVALVIVWVGLPMLMATMLAWRGAAMAERRLIRWSFGAHIPDPYRPRPPSGFKDHLDWLFGDGATWRDLGYLILCLPLGMLDFVTLATFIGGGLGFIVLPPWALPYGEDVVFWGWQVDTPVEAIPIMLLGVVLLVLGLYAVHGLAWLRVAVAKLLLGADEAKLLVARNAHLTASRARGVDAAETERRRIERDLHDGAQQRLLAVALDLGRARARMAEDPDGARLLLDSAHEGTKAAIGELRDLARGIYPAILTDRGLDAALSSLAARAPVRVEVTVEIAERPPAAVESIAYFIVAESLSNMAKHSGASAAWVRVGRAGRSVVVEVGDDGVGGARSVSGGGLAGLADRAATIDGVLTVDSPPGGGTRVTAELPCTW